MCWKFHATLTKGLSDKKTNYSIMTMEITITHLNIYAANTFIINLISKTTDFNVYK